MIFDLLYHRELGDLVQPERPDRSTGGNFEVVSWEQLGTYPADVIHYDDRLDITTVDLDPIWNLLPAVQANQTGPWTVLPALLARAERSTRAPARYPVKR